MIKMTPQQVFNSPSFSMKMTMLPCNCLVFSSPIRVAPEKEKGSYNVPIFHLFLIHID